MNPRSDSPPSPADAPVPYDRFGIPSDATLDEVLAANMARLLAVSGDHLAAPKGEAVIHAVV